MHETSALKKLEKGDMVTIEIWGSYRHYTAGAQGTIYVGDAPPEELVNTYKMVSDMYVATRNVIKAGTRTGDVYDAANEVYRARQGADYFRVTGYSLGLGFGNIRLAKGGQDVLSAGLPLLVQVGVFVPLCVICAASVIVTEHGWEEVTMPLIDLTIKKSDN